MALSASPYTEFRVEEWLSDVAQPIGIGQCLRLAPRNCDPIKSSIQYKKGNSLKIEFYKKHVQLAFA